MRRSSLLNAMGMEIVKISRESALFRVSKAAEANGGKCLSDSCKTTHDRVTLQCAEGHAWDTVALVILRGAWCRRCHIEAQKTSPKAAQRSHYYLDKIRAIVEPKGGQCLSTECKTRRDRVTMQCAHGHQWDAVFNKVLEGYWCRQCRDDARRGSIEEVQMMAAQHSGKCLSTTYRNRQIKLTFECKNGHVWDATPNKIQQGGWCPQCQRAASKTPLSEIQALAATKGGVCLSTTYGRKTTPLQFRCGQGHLFELRLDSLKNRGHWCKHCSRYTLEDMQKMAVDRGGRCVSIAYVNTKTHLLWECADGHQWRATPGHVYTEKTWCPVCSHGKKRKSVTRKKSGKMLLFGKVAA